MAESIASNGQLLSNEESASLAELETVIEQGLASFVEVGNALLAIREQRLYREIADTFEGYCQIKWGFTRRRADQLVDAAKIAAAFGNENHGSQISPGTERQARELGRVSEPLRQEVWTEAVDTAPKGVNGKPKVTAAHVRRVADKGRAAIDASSTEGVRDNPEQPAAADAPDVPVDAVGQTLPPRVRPAFDGARLFDEALNHFAQITARINKIADSPAGAMLPRQSLERDLENARSAVKFARPHAVCPHCRGSGSGNGCSAAGGCRGLGWMTADQYERVPRELKMPPAGKGRAA